MKRNADPANSKQKTETDTNNRAPSRSGQESTLITMRVLLQSGAILVALAVAFLGSVWVFYDFHLVEKILTAWAMPLGLFAVALLWTCLALWRSGQRAQAEWAFILLAGYCLLNNSYTSLLFGRPLEGRYDSVDPLKADQYDAIVVLGGGAKFDDQGHAALQSSGDRVVLAARLFLQGKVKHLIATGASHKWSGGQSLAECTRVIWLQLGIPRENIHLIEGVNTSQEMQKLKTLFASGRLPFDKTARIGLLTSATHLPRAVRLAQQAGFDFRPIAANFLTPIDHPFPLAIQPNATAAYVTRTACKEYLAALVGR